MEPEDAVDSLASAAAGGRGPHGPVEAPDGTVYRVVEADDPWWGGPEPSAGSLRVCAGAGLEVEVIEAGRPEARWTLRLAAPAGGGGEPVALPAKSSWQARCAVGWSVLATGPHGTGAQRAGSSNRVRGQEVLAGAWRTWRAEWRRIVVVALIVSVVLTGSELLIAHFARPAGGWTRAGLDLLVTVENVLGLAALVGVLVALVGSTGHGVDDRGTAAIVKSLPYRRLMGAEALVGLVVAAGILAFVLPGLALFTLLALAGAVLDIEDLSVWGAFRRSAQLVWHQFFKVALLTTLPFFVGGALVSVGLDAARGLDPVAFQVLAGAANSVLEVVTALLTVELAYQMLEAQGSGFPASGTHAAPSPAPAVADQGAGHD